MGQVQRHVANLTPPGLEKVEETEHRQHSAQDTGQAIHPPSQRRQQAAQQVEHFVEAQPHRQVGQEYAKGERHTHNQNLSPLAPAQCQVGDEKGQRGEGTGVETIHQASEDDGDNTKGLEALNDALLGLLGVETSPHLLHAGGRVLLNQRQQCLGRDVGADQVLIANEERRGCQTLLLRHIEASAQPFRQCGIFLNAILLD